MLQDYLLAKKYRQGTKNLAWRFGLGLLQRKKAQAKHLAKRQAIFLAPCLSSCDIHYLSFLTKKKRAWKFARPRKLSLKFQIYNFKT